MKAGGWISMRRSLEDALKNAFEETTMKNVPIDQFWSFKWKNGVQNCNLHEKLSKRSPSRNFDFWSNINAKVKGQTQLVQGQSQQIHGPSRFWVFWVGHGSAVETLTHPNDVALTWTRADVDVLMWLLTWSDDVTWWHQHEFFSA